MFELERRGVLILCRLLPVAAVRLLFVSLGLISGFLLADGRTPAAQAQDVGEVPASPADSLAAEAPEDSAAAPEALPPLPPWHETLELLRAAERSMDSLLVYEQRLYSSSEEEREILRVRARDALEIVNETPDKLLEQLTELERTDAPVDSIRQAFGEFIVDKVGIYERTYDFWTDQLNGLRSQRGLVDSDQLGDLELKIDDARKRLDDLLKGMSATLTVGDSLRLETRQAWVALDDMLVTRAENLAGRMEVAVKQRNNLARQVRDKEGAGAPESEIGLDRIQLRYAERRVTGIAHSLDAMVQLLNRRQVDTTDFRKTMIRATGEITVDLLDPGVLGSLFRDYASDLWTWFKERMPTILLRVVLVIAFIIVFRLLFRAFWWLLGTIRIVRLPRLTRALIDGLVQPLGSVVGLFVGLWFLGVNAAALLAGVGVAGVIVGLALQDSLANLASGFFILVTRPYDVDDVVKTGTVLGTVKKMGLANTTIRTFDGRRLMVPNRKIWGEVIENRSAEMVRRVEITVRVGYDEDLDQVLQLLRAICDNEERVLRKPEPDIFVLDLEQSWILIAVRPWVKNQDWWPLLTQLPRLVRLRFREEGIDIPYPRSDVAWLNPAEPVAEPPRAADKKEAPTSPEPPTRS
jgi:small conductance mechanosensitive channel